MTCSMDYGISRAARSCAAGYRSRSLWDITLRLVAAAWPP
jgi:hypothetical protein